MLSTLIKSTVNVALYREICYSTVVRVKQERYAKYAGQEGIHLFAAAKLARAARSTALPHPAEKDVCGF